MIGESLLFTERELDVVDKKLNNVALTQQDSNYLSRFVRPKLREIGSIDSRSLLYRLKYNQKGPAIEKRIKHLVLRDIRNVSSITLYGSVVYNNYHDYKDIDVLVAVRKRFWRKIGEKHRKMIEIKKQAKKQGLNVDIEVYEDKTLCKAYPSNISLVYQLKNRKTIYGKFRLPRKIKIPRLEIRMKIDYSILDDERPDGEEIYKAIRNLWLINLALERIIDNLRLNGIIEDELGKNLVHRLKSNRDSRTDKKIALLYLNKLLKDTLKKVDEARWERIAL